MIRLVSLSKEELELLHNALALQIQFQSPAPAAEILQLQQKIQDEYRKLDASE